MASGNGAQYRPGGGAPKVPLWTGMYAASVVQNKDPQGLSRLRLQIPQVLGTAVSGWALPMVPFQGVPAIGAQVSAMFIGGDPTRPAWFGSLELTEPGTLITLGDGPPTTPGTQTGAIYYNMAGGVNNGMFEWNGTTWTEYSIGGSAIAGGAISLANLASDVLADINGKNAATVGSALPASGKLGDVWIQTNATTGAVTNIYECTTAYTSGGVMGDWTLESAVTARSLGSPFTYQQSATPNTANNASNPPQLNDLWINTASGNVLAQMTGGTPASPTWTQIKFSSGALATSAGILGTQIAQATISGSNIAAETITANLINTGDSLNPNPYFGGGDTSSWHTFANSGTLPTFTAVTTTNFGYPWCANVAAAAGSAFPQIYSTNFAVNVGDPIQVNGWFNTNASLQFTIGYYDHSGNFVTQTVANVGASTGVWQYQALVGTVPSTLSGAGLPITQANLSVKVNSGSTAGTEVFQATGLTVMSKVHGGLIEAGTITASQINVADLIANGINGQTITGVTFNGTNWTENVNGQFLYSGSVPPPTVTTTTTGGTVPAGTYYVQVSYVNATGESVASNPTVVTTTGTTSTITVHSPAATGNATGWYAYVSTVGNITEKRQQAAGSPTAIGTNLTLTATPTTTGVTPPGPTGSGLSTPTAGGLVASITPAAGTDAYGNAYLAGITSYSINAGGQVFATQIGYGPGNAVQMYTASTYAGPFTAGVNIGIGTAGELLLSPTGTAPVVVGANNSKTSLILVPGAAPASSAWGSQFFNDNNGFLRAFDGDGLTYALGMKLNQNASNTNIASGGAYGTIMGGGTPLGVGTYRISGQIAYTTSTASPTGQPRVIFTGGTAVGGTARGSFSSNGVPVQVNAALASTGTFAGANLIQTTVQIMSFDFVLPITTAGTFLVQAASTGSSFQVPFANLFIEPL